MKLTDEMLERAVREARSQTLLEIPDTELQGEHNFTPRFEKKMSRLLRKGRKGIPAGKGALWPKRAVASLAVVLVVVSTTIMSVDALRTRFFKMIAVKNPEYTSITYQAADGAEEAAQVQIQSATDNFVPCNPAYIPEGYKIIEDNDMGGASRMIWYEKDDKNRIMFSQYIMGTVGMSIDTEDALVEEVQVGKETATYISKNGNQTVIWNDDIYAYTLMVGSEDNPMSKKEVLEIAESVGPQV